MMDRYGEYPLLRIHCHGFDIGRLHADGSFEVLEEWTILL